MIGQYYTIPRSTTDRTETVTVTVTVVQPWAPHRTGTHTYSFSLVSLSVDYRGGTLFPKKTFSSLTYHPTFFFLCLHRFYGTGKPSRHPIPINTTIYNTYLGTGTQEEREFRHTYYRLPPASSESSREHRCSFVPKRANNNVTRRT